MSLTGEGSTGHGCTRRCFAPENLADGARDAAHRVGRLLAVPWSLAEYFASYVGLTPVVFEPDARLAEMLCMVGMQRTIDASGSW